MKRILSHIAHTFGALLVVFSTTSASAQQTHEDILLEAFTNIEAIVIALREEQILTVMSYGFKESAAIPADFRHQIKALRQTASEHYSALKDKQPLIEEMGPSTINKHIEGLASVIERLARLRVSFGAVVNAFQMYQTQYEAIDKDLLNDAKDREISSMKVRRAADVAIDFLTELQRHILYRHLNLPVSVSLHLRSQLLSMYDYRMIEITDLSEKISANQPLYKFRKEEAYHYAGYISHAWNHVESFASAHMGRKVHYKNLPDIQRIFLDEFEETRRTLYDLSDGAVDEANDPYNVTVNYKRTAAEWHETVKRLVAPIHILLGKVRQPSAKQAHGKKNTKDASN